MLKSNDQKLRDFIKANKEYRAKLAKNAGFDTPEQYKEYLLALITGGTAQSQEENGVKPTIHIVDILDASGSMEGGKYENSKAGILKGIENLRTDNTVNYTYSLIEFVDDFKTNTHQILGGFPYDIKFNGANGFNTPLYKVVFETLSKLTGLVKPEEKVLVKVYTDGGNNTARDFTEPCKRLVSELNEKNFTITFVATQQDLDMIVRDIKVDVTNTFAVTNDAVGFMRGFETSLGATRSYASKVLLKQDVKKGFYKDLVKK